MAMIRFKKIQTSFSYCAVVSAQSGRVGRGCCAVFAKKQKAAYLLPLASGFAPASTDDGAYSRWTVRILVWPVPTLVKVRASGN